MQSGVVICLKPCTRNAREYGSNKAKAFAKRAIRYVTGRLARARVALSNRTDDADAIQKSA